MRFLAVLLLLCVGAAAPSAQVALTAQAGLQVADMAAEDPLVGEIDPSLDARVQGQSPRYGLRAGVGLRVPLTPTVAIHPQVVYAQKGHKLSYELDPGDIVRVTSDRFYDDIEGLVMVSADVLHDERLAAAIEAGPALLVRLGGVACRAPRPSAPCVVDDDPGRVSVGLAVGAVVSAGPGGVGVRYTRGGRDTAPEGTEAKPTAETIAVTFRLRFR